MAVLANLSMSVREAWLLFGLFWAQFIVGAVGARVLARGRAASAWASSTCCWGFAVILRDRGRLPTLLRDGFRTPHAELHAAPDGD